MAKPFSVQLQGQIAAPHRGRPAYQKTNGYLDRAPAMA
jgi:hypothetical protein